MRRSEKFAWLTIIAVEASAKIITGIGLYYFWTYSLESELFRTPLRLLVILIYWRLLRSFIKSATITASSLFPPPLLLPIALFMSVPLLVGDLSYMTLTTKVVYAITSVVVALREEIAYRALIQSLLAKRYGNLTAILVTTVLFTAFHIGVIPLSLFAYGQVVIASLFLGIIYARTQNLWLVVWLHTLYDALWSLTPVLSPPLPYSIGLAVLLVSLLFVARWGWSSIRPNPTVNMDAER
jgi:membrane protease YdiL (CAAX protease family)